MNRINWWYVTKAGVLFLCVGLVASVRADDGVTRLDNFSLSWPQLVGILGGVAFFAGGLAEMRRWMVDIDRRLEKLERQHEED